MDMDLLFEALSGGTNQRERARYIRKRGIESADYISISSPILTEERLDWLKINTKVDMDLVSYNLSSVPMLTWRKKNGLTVMGINVKNPVATGLCLSMISDRNCRKWINDRSIRCTDVVARMLINFCKTRGLPHPRLVRFKHVNWLIDESYLLDSEWVLSKGVRLDLRMLMEVITLSGYKELVERCTNKFGKQTLMNLL